MISTLYIELMEDLHSFFREQLFKTVKRDRIAKSDLIETPQKLTHVIER